MAEKDKQKKNTDKTKVQPSKPTTATSKAASQEDEIVSILQQIRSEQKESNHRLDEFNKRLEQMELYDYADCNEDNTAYYHYDETESECRDGSSDGQKRKADETDLNDSRFASMAKRFKTVELCDKDIEPVLADNINELFLKGMDEDQYTEIIRDETLPRPANCEGLVTVKLNQLIWDIVSPTARSRDKELQNIETSCVKSACILAKTVDKLARIDANALESPIEGINDAIALLGHTNKQINMLRRDLLKPELRNEYNHLCTHSLPYTNQLFGDDVSKTAKEIEECSKMGYKLQYGSGRGAYGFFRPRGGRGRGRGLTRGFRGRGSSEYQTPNYQASKNSRRGVGTRRM